jgi:A/G-specific adenine glycosylase
MGKPSTELTPSSAQAFDGVFFAAKLVKWYEINARPLPWRELWQSHRDPWHIWVSEIMLQQTVIKSVLRVYTEFLREFPDHRTLANATPEKVKLAVRGLGYYRRFDALHRACKQLAVEKRSLPATHSEWLELPGIGDYTAAAVASITANEPQGVVDGNVERVLCRMLDIRSAPNLPPLKRLFKKMMNDMCSLVSPGNFNQAVMELGQVICTPTNPRCSACPVTAKCLAFKRKSQSLAPAPKQQIKLNDVNLRLHIVRKNDKFLLMKRPNDAKFMAGTWGFLTDIQQGQKWTQDGSSELIETKMGRKVGSFKHSITNHRIIALVVQSNSQQTKKNIHTKFLGADDVEKNLVSNLDRKAWSLLLRNSERQAD